MRPVPRLGLLLAAFALPLGAVLASHVLGDRTAPRAPVDVQVGDSRSEGGIGRPSTPPSPAAVRPLVVGERTTLTSSTTPELPAELATPGPAGPVTAVTPAAPRAEPTDPADADSKGKAKGRIHPPPSHGATPEDDGSPE